MATQTFMNLKDEKKEKIITALKNEFGRVALKDALVSNIIKEASIPRGSFYQYFTDINDAYYYLISEYSTKIKKFLLDDIKKTNGDIILSYRHLYIYILDLISNKDNKNFFEKLFLNLDYEAQSMFTPDFNDGLNKMINVIDINKLNIQSKFSIAYVLDIIEAVLMSNIVKSYKRNLSKEKNIEVFEKELALICAGIMKK